MADRVDISKLEGVLQSLDDALLNDNGVVVRRSELKTILAELRQHRERERKKPKWVRCSERLPEAGVAVLIAGHDWPSPVVAKLILESGTEKPSCWSDSDGDGEVYYLDDVHWWRPLPPPPEPTP